jgi:hypothetical protein
MIDPLEALLALCKQTAGLNTVTGGRIDDRHHYGQDAGDWPLDAKSLTLMPVGGAADNYLPVQAFQLDAYCYGDTYYEAGEVYRELRKMLPAHRRVVEIDDETNALIYFMVVVSQQRRFLDDEARPNGGMPCYLVQLSAEVAEQAVP